MFVNYYDTRNRFDLLLSGDWRVRSNEDHTDTRRRKRMRADSKENSPEQVNGI